MDTADAAKDAAQAAGTHDAHAAYASVGHAVPRTEDERHLHGAGRFVADIHWPGGLHLAFVRSTVAHGVLRSVRAPALRTGESFWTAADLEDIARPIVAKLNRPGFQSAPYPCLATDRVRFAGQTIAAVVASSRARAEDLAEMVEVDIDPLPPIASARAAFEAGAPLMHEGWSGNHFMKFARTFGDFDAAAARAEVHLTRRYRMERLAPSPLETRGCLSVFDRAQGRLLFHTCCQRPHIQRDFLAEQLIGIDEHRIQVLVPDVGGAFGVKTNLYPEELAVAAISIRLGAAARWIEDRMEHLLSACHARENDEVVTLHANRDGEILAMEAEYLVDGGAYSMLPSTSAVEANMSANVMPGPYRIRNYRATAMSACTNKAPTGPYRGVGRPAACFAMERTLDELAHVLGIEPHELRRRNLIAADAFPYTSATGLVYDTGNYPPMMDTAVRALGHEGVRAAQSVAPVDARERIGIGYAWYVEQTAHTAKEFFARGSVVLYGFESARIKMDIAGSLTIETSVCSHGQGHATTLAQIASEVTSIPMERISVRAGDTDVVPYGNGTFASRSVVLAGGAVHQACGRLVERLRAIAAHLMQCAPEALKVDAQAVHGPAGTEPLPFARLAHAALQYVHELPDGIEPGLEFMSSYRPSVETGAFSAGVHAAKVAVDVETGAVRLLDYLVVEDCGQTINPMIVDGQVYGGVAQGIGQALLEELRYDAQGQPGTVTLADYLLPGFGEVPEVRIEHQHTLSPFTAYGMKGTGEGGCIGGPAAIGNAVTDALRGLGVSVTRAPVTARDVWTALEAARQREDASSGPCFTWTPPP
ncbi:MAG: xanthine dehydrogenase family protein molybdopterin-binding subunit [Pseudomonadota bacterium]